MKFIERKPSYLPKLADIQPKVRAALVRQMAEAKALEQATTFLKQVKNPAGFAAAAAAAKLATHSTGDFSRADSSIPTVGEFHEAVQAASLLPATPGIINRPLTLDGNAYVFEVVSRTPPTEDNGKRRSPRSKTSWSSSARRRPGKALLRICARARRSLCVRSSSANKDLRLSPERLKKKGGKKREAMRITRSNGRMNDFVRRRPPPIC